VRYRLKKSSSAKKFFQAIDQDSHIDYFKLIERFVTSEVVETPFCDLPFNFVAGVDEAKLNVYDAHNKSVHLSLLQQQQQQQQQQRQRQRQTEEDITCVTVPPGHVLLVAGV
jgi:hypothetical protein